SQISKNNTPNTPVTTSKAAQKAPARPKDDNDSKDEENQLRKQVALTNQKFHEQTLRATQFQKELQAFRTSANVTLTPFNGRERFKFNPLTTFDNIPGQFKRYLVQIRIYQTFHLEIFRSEIEKMVYAATFFRGKALFWFELLLQEWFNIPPEKRRQKVTDIFSTFAGYKRTFRSLFQESDEKRQTERDLANLRQTKSTFTYTAEFRRLVTRLDITEKIKIFQFY
ncbi:hypothetical protein PspLS_06370, partial [Pyricularia sp. CBS 133598]